jgi:hypothetical protein
MREHSGHESAKHLPRAEVVFGRQNLYLGFACEVQWPDQNLSDAMSDACDCNKVLDAGLKSFPDRP